MRDDASRVAGPLMALEALAATGIRVRSLGTFAVLRDGHPVPTSAWQSRKTRDLLKLLVGRTGGLTRDALAEFLWPGQSGTGGRLSTVLSTLRSVLDPERRHPPDRYLVADRARVRLDRSTVTVDADEFRAAALPALALARGGDVGGEKAIAGLERAAAGYTGDYLEGDDAPWATETRIELRALADQVRRELARLLLDAGRPDAAISWLVSLVADDPYDEASHRTLVGALSRAGRHGEARRRYALYAARMAELGTEPAPLADLRT